MTETTLILLGTAATIALMHTLAGPDHYLPLVILGRTEKWSLKKIMGWTALCGAGHVLSSVLVGALGIAFGWHVNSLTWFEGVRGSVAVWALIGFGFIYMAWGIYRGIQGKGHFHLHDHSHGQSHTHVHGHSDEHHHDHDNVGSYRNKTWWAIVLIFVLGPCEPLIPMLLIPAAEHSIAAITMVAAVFSAVTIATMMGAVLLAYMGFELIEFKVVRRYMHAFSGFAIGASGLLILALQV